MRSAFQLLSLLVVSWLFPSESMACLGEDRLWAEHALSAAREPSRTETETFLASVAGCGHASDELPRTADLHVYEVLRLAVHLGADPSLVRRALEEHRCAYSQRGEEGFPALLDYVGAATTGELCDLGLLESLLFVLPQQGAVVRAAESTGSRRLGALASDVVVRSVSTNGEWHMVETSWGLRGYMHRSVVAQY